MTNSDIFKFLSLIARYARQFTITHFFLCMYSYLFIYEIYLAKAAKRLQYCVQPITAACCIVQSRFLPPPPLSANYKK